MLIEIHPHYHRHKHKHKHPVRGAGQRLAFPSTLKMTPLFSPNYLQQTSLTQRNHVNSIINFLQKPSFCNAGNRARTRTRQSLAQVLVRTPTKLLTHIPILFMSTVVYPSIHSLASTCSQSSASSHLVRTHK